MTAKNITKVTYSETANLGNYESCRVELTADIAIDSEWQVCLEQLKMLVRNEITRVKTEHKAQR